MKKWKCTVCGYIHEGDSPPDRCPICGAPKEKFIELIEADEKENTVNNDMASSEIKTDIIVVGSGAAALAAAVTAKQLDMEVIVLEKADTIGGTTARSGGGFWIPNNRHQRDAGIVDAREDAIRYMVRYSYPNLYNPDAKRLGLPEREYEIICSYYDNASKAIDFLEECGAIKTIMEINWTGKPQVDYMDHLPENKGIRGRSIYTEDENGKLAMGYNLIAQLANWLNDKGVEIRTNHEVNRIRRDDNGRVIGVTAVSDGKEQVFHASRGVIFGSGGYSHSPELMLQFQPGPHYGGCAVPSNTGDFIRMAGGIGATIGNTRGAFRAQSMIDLFLENPEGSSNVFYIPGDSIIEVNKFGKRTMDEKRNYTDRAMTHFVWDPVRAEWTNMLQFLIYDSRTAMLWQGYPPFPVQSQQLPSYILSGDTVEELTAAITERLTKLAPHTGKFSLAAEFLPSLKATIAQFNEYAQNGKDLEFGRGDQNYDREWTTFPPTVPNVQWPEEGSKNYTMHPMSESGPYYAIILAAGTLDTSGGPLTDGDARVLDWNGQPIAGLYGAGNCVASPTANAYWGAGSTIGPGLAFGYLAALDASK